MAVDTRDKRASVLGLGLAALLVLPEPGAIDQPDRQHLAYSYRGVMAGEAVIIEGDLVTTAEAYFRRTMTLADGTFVRSVTTRNAER